MAAKVGDNVRFLNDVGGGTIVKINGNMAYVADTDGFETPVLLRECVVVGHGDAAVKASAKNTTEIETDTIKPTDTVQPIEDSVIDIVETDYGDKLNIVLGFEARDLKHLSSTMFDGWLVNDSNYYNYFTILSRSNDSEKWSLLYSGTVEPNTQLPVAEFGVADLSSLEHIAVQLIPFKRDKDFYLKKAVDFETRLDTTKFAKLHCFKDNVYFDNPVIAIEIVKDDKTCKTYDVTDSSFNELVTNKDTRNDRPQRHRISKKAQKRNGSIVVDLHASELLDNLNGLSNADILNYQVDSFRSTMDENLTNFGQKIIFIHGKGDGVLRQALLKELNYRYPQCSVQDASFKEYGYGATQVTINKRNNRQ